MGRAHGRAPSRPARGSPGAARPCRRAAGATSIRVRPSQRPWPVTVPRPIATQRAVGVHLGEADLVHGGEDVPGGVRQAALAAGGDGEPGSRGRRGPAATGGTGRRPRRPGRGAAGAGMGQRDGLHQRRRSGAPAPGVQFGADRRGERQRRVDHRGLAALGVPALDRVDGGRPAGGPGRRPAAPSWPGRSSRRRRAAASRRAGPGSGAGQASSAASSSAIPRGGEPAAWRAPAWPGAPRPRHPHAVPGRWRR